MKRLTPPRAKPTGKRFALIALGGVAGLAVGLAGVYGIGRLTGNAAADPACKAAVETAGRMAPLARGEVAAVSVAKQPEKPAGAGLQGRPGADEIARRLARPHRAAEPVGDLVRALPQGNAGARRPGAQARRREFRGGGHQHRHPRSRQAEGTGSSTSASRRSPITPTPTPRCSRTLRSIGKAFGMPTTLIVDRSGCEIAHHRRARPNGPATTR